MNFPNRILWASLVMSTVLSTGLATAEVLDPRTLTKYMDPLSVPGAMPVAGPNYYEIGAWQIQQQLHSQLPPSTVYGYGTSEATASYPGATIVAQKGVPISIKWTNHLPMTHILDYAIDPTIPKAITTTGVPITPHVHGCEVEPQSDGTPMTWFTAGFAEKGHDWVKEVLTYANSQLPATIWYHDHAFGYTRHNVYAGLAGFYVITDPGNEPAGLPSGPYDIGLAIQDRMFTTEGQLWYPNEGESDVHPIWIPEFFGDVILVNGKVWPYLNVEPRKYRFRILEGSNARFYSLALSDRVTGAPGPAFYQIATDGGYLAEPVLLNDPNDVHSPRLLMAPGERAEVVIDFSAYAPGSELVLKNVAKAPFPNGEAPNPETVGQIMLFRVVPLTAPDNSVIPQTLVPVNRLSNPTVTRVMTLNEQMDGDDPVAAFLNGMPYHDTPATEYPTLGTTEMWEIVNMTGDAHPIHLHLVQFQLFNRQKINSKRYEQAFMQANPVMPADTYVPVPVEPYLKGKPKPADPNEQGWKDTFRMNPGEVTRILVRFAPQDESPEYAFDATAAPGYVWHCHILEHEENDMMRPYYLQVPVAASQSQPTQLVGRMSILTAGATTLWAPQPNPTAGGATFRFSLRTPGPVELDLFSITGQRLCRLASGLFPAGEHAARWDGTDGKGRSLASGVYFVNPLSANVRETPTPRKFSVEGEVGISDVHESGGRCGGGSDRGAGEGQAAAIQRRGEDPHSEGSRGLHEAG
ncbi:MAG: multicopper oxidase domain-containing protein [Candidatus Eiseniibacteriota bacterium]